VSLAPDLLQRIDALLQRGSALASRRKHDGEYGPTYWVQSEMIPDVQAWMTSAANLISLTTSPGSYFREELERITTDKQLAGGAPWAVVQKMHGLLAALKDEASHGLLRRLEDVVVATAFDDFLDHAEAFHRANKAREAGVLAAIVLEDTIKRIAAKNNVDGSGLTLEPLVDALVKAGVFTPVKAKRVKAYAGVRNPALHAEWNKFDIRDAGELISGTRELIEHFL
jgi:uncharacterized protein YutE (UPF0331/DUF86 family)